jgi:hypothetical protein
MAGGFPLREVFRLSKRDSGVGDSGFEPLTSSASRKRSPPELIARKTLSPRGGTRNRTGVQGFADPCLTTRPCRQPARGQSGRRESNPRPSPWQGDALPAELRPRAEINLARCLPSYKRLLNHLLLVKTT